jgi:glutaredoxin
MSPAPSGTGGPRIELLTRPGCSLCTTARDIVDRVAADEGVRWGERNVDDQPEDADEYGDRVPVVLLDGREHAYWRVDERRLRDALHGRRSW